MTHWLLRNGFTSLLTLLFGLGIVALPTLAVAAIAPDGTADLEDYRAAGPCSSAPAGPSDCLWTVELTVSDVHLDDRGTRSPSYTTVLTDARGGTWESSYGDRGPVVHRLDVGDRVTGTVWRGELTEIAFEDRTQATRDAPADLRTRVLIGALVSVPSGLLLAATSLWRLARLHEPEPTEGMGATLGLSGTLIAIACLALVLTSRLGENLWAVLAVWLPLSALAAFGFRLSVTRRRARTAEGVEGADGSAAP
ncbi:hypothetical protein BJF83_14160 [Nocardiopsis sp. CNR-923]|uniref:hypothetical protein n=1 Tax=Nocardiopsis sp. CNR-923 TaxID=1904965 RepID=UPI000968CFC6|nr:hypothetical protein [Nocardiopsis sp. CNR-923]OLT28775.1 hypothetical protein BJF83_14160 [Nocardiopsis sp. CNR-923]